ncbi:MAG: universal stress protein [Opitutae bacterium]|nr:universal stress protein [Opitutae bacterium]
MKKTILVPVGLSEATVQVCKAARDLALALDARLLIAHALEAEPLVNSYYALSAFEVTTFTNDVRRRTAEKMQSLGRWFRRSVPQTKIIVHTGAAAATILRMARLAHVDYIVLGSHGHTAAYELLAGSVAHAVIRHAPCPVVLVPIAPRPKRIAAATPAQARVELAGYR